MGLTDERGQQRNHRHRKTRSQCQALGGVGGQREAVLWASGPLVWAAAIREASTGPGRVWRGKQTLALQPGQQRGVRPPKGAFP